MLNSTKWKSSTLKMKRPFLKYNKQTLKSSVTKPTWTIRAIKRDPERTKQFVADNEEERTGAEEDT